MFLLDTNVISASAPRRQSANPDVSAWLIEHSELLFLSVVTVTEIEAGIAKAARTGAIRKAAELDQWLGSILDLYARRIITLDLEIARRVGRLADLARGLGHMPEFEDMAIAATAQQHDYIVLTRNLRHFKALQVPVHDPFAALPQA